MGRHEADPMGTHEAEAMGRHEAEAMGRQTDLVLDASLPKHKNSNKLVLICNNKFVNLYILLLTFYSYHITLFLSRIILYF